MNDLWRQLHTGEEFRGTGIEPRTSRSRGDPCQGADRQNTYKAVFPVNRHRSEFFFSNFHFSKFFLFHPIQFSIFQISIFTQVSIFGLSWDSSEISATEQILLRFGIIFVDRLSAAVAVVVVVAAVVVIDLFVRQSKVLLPDWGLDNAMNLARAEYPRETRAHEIRNQWKTLTKKSNQLVVSLPEIKRTFYYEQVCFLKAEKCGAIRTWRYDKRASEKITVPETKDSLIASNFWKGYFVWGKRQFIKVTF